MPKKLKKQKVKKTTKVKKQTRRSKAKYPNLDVAYNLVTRQEEIADLASYAHKLNDKEKAWLDKFAGEYVNASFGSKPLHKTKKQRKSVYDRNNSRFRDVLTKAKATRTLVSLEDYNIYNSQSNDDIDDGSSGGK